MCHWVFFDLFNDYESLSTEPKDLDLNLNTFKEVNAKIWTKQQLQNLSRWEKVFLVESEVIVVAELPQNGPGGFVPAALDEQPVERQKTWERFQDIQQSSLY